MKATSTRQRRWTTVLTIVALLGDAEVAVSATGADSPTVKATLFFKNPPPRAVYSPATPITVILQMETTERTITVEGFSDDDFRRYLIVTGPEGVASTPIPGPRFHRHTDAKVFNCSFRGGQPQFPAIPVAPVEILPDPADEDPFVLEIVVEDLRKIIEFGPGRHTLQARIPLIAFREEDIIRDCDDTLADVVDLRAGTAFTVTSEMLEFIDSILGVGGFAKPLVNDSECAEPPCATFNFGRQIPVKIRDVVDADGEAVKTASIGISLTRLAGVPPDVPFPEGQEFRFDAGLGNYIFNLDTSLLAPGVWQIDATFEDGAVRSVQFGLE